jgi:dipeptidyl aminopeptidase/acylaminoacyl peptidase
VHPRRALTGVALLLAVTACTGEPDRRDTKPTSSATPGSPSATSSPGDATTSATPEGTRRRVDPVSVPALFDKTYDGRDLRLGQVLARTAAYTSYTVTYRSGDLRVSAKLDVPTRKGPRPAVVLAHGYIDPAVYVNGQGMRREQDWLARAGYVVLHVDYRNHAGSSKVPSAERNLRLGYTVDVVNAVKALRRTTAVPVDDRRIGLVGRSMGGGVVYNALVAQPGLVDAAVVFDPVSSLAADNFDRWIRHDPGRGTLSDAIVAAHGTPERNTRFWRAASPRPYFGRITEPVLVHHGQVDKTCPLRWSRATVAAMKKAGVDVQFRIYAGEDHAFYAAWPLAMRRTTAFLRANL